jgi:hypothetical protein
VPKLDRNRTIALSEYLIKCYLDMLDTVKEETKAFVDTKRLMTEKERVSLWLFSLVMLRIFMSMHTQSCKC